MKKRFVDGPALLFAFGFSFSIFAQEKQLPEGVTAKDVTYYSEHVACYGRVFFPEGFDANGQTAGIVLAPGFAETAASIEPMAAELAARGLVAMAIDYRGWGKSGAFLRLAEPIREDDRLRFAPFTAKVQFKRNRLLPEAQIEDIRNAISFLQGEPGVDPQRIGLWGTDFSGGHVITVAARDARIKAGVCQAAQIDGESDSEEAFDIPENLREDAINRARKGQGGMAESSKPGLMLDVETTQAQHEYRPFHDIRDIPKEVPILFISAAGGENEIADARAAADALRNQGNTIKAMFLNGVAADELGQGKNLKTTSKAAAEWFAEHLK
jgi:dienelactone hydrolase